MSYSQTAPPNEGNSELSAAGGRASSRTVKRPGALTSLVWAAVVSAVSGIAGAVIVFSGGTGLADSNVKEVIKQHPDTVGLPPGMTADSAKALAGPLWQQLIDDRASTLSSRAGFAVFIAVCMLLFAFFARKATVWSRVLVTLSGLVGILPSYLIISDYEPTSVTALSWIALIAGVAAVALCWAPSVSRFAKEHRMAN